MDVAVAIGAGDHLAFRCFRGVYNLVAHGTDHGDRPGIGGRLRLRLEWGDDKGLLALRACGFLTGVRPGDTKMPAAMLTVELDPVVSFGDDAVDVALGAFERPACKMVRDIESFTT